MSRTYPRYDGLEPKGLEILVRSTEDAVEASQLMAAASEEVVATWHNPELRREWANVATYALGRFSLLYDLESLDRYDWTAAANRLNGTSSDEE